MTGYASATGNRRLQPVRPKLSLLSGFWKQVGFGIVWVIVCIGVMALALLEAVWVALRVEGACVSNGESDE